MRYKKILIITAIAVFWFSIANLPTISAMGSDTSSLTCNYIAGDWECNYTEHHCGGVTVYDEYSMVIINDCSFTQYMSFGTFDGIWTISGNTITSNAIDPGACGLYTLTATVSGNEMNGKISSTHGSSGTFYCKRTSEPPPPDPEWTTAYRTMFSNQSDLELLRQYRDELLTNSVQGKLYTYLLYKSSEEALEVLLNNPRLMLRARRLIEANKDAVAEVLDENRGVIYNTDEIISFLDAYTRKSPASLRLLAITVKKEMLEKQEQGESFLGFELH